MRVFRKLGSMALAAALTITLVAPISANAALNRSTPRSFSSRYWASSVDTVNVDYSSGKAVYTDFTTGKTSENEYDFYSYNVPKKVQIPICEYSTINIYLRNGNTQIKNLKSSNKGTIVAKLSKSYTVETSSEKENVSTDENGKLYYTEQWTGKKVYINSEDEAPNESYARYGIRLYAKKGGTSTISYQVYDKDGKKSGKKVSIKVTAKEVDAFKSLTFAGKSLLYDTTTGAANSKYIYQGKNDYTTKKSGKVKIKMNKGYKLLKVFTGVENPYRLTPDSSDPEYADYVQDKTDNSQNKWLSEISMADDYRTWTDRGTKKSFTLKLGSNLGYNNGYDRTYSKSKHTYRSQSTTAPTVLVIFFRDNASGRVYYDTYTINRLIEK